MARGCDGDQPRGNASAAPRPGAQPGGPGVRADGVMHGSASMAGVRRRFNTRCDAIKAQHGINAC
eukprot:4450739-Alexandrium_andersonii.AAC.1